MVFLIKSLVEEKMLSGGVLLHFKDYKSNQSHYKKFKQKQYRVKEISALSSQYSSLPNI